MANNAERSVVVYPLIPSTTQGAIYPAIAPRANFAYRTNTAPVTPANPGGRTHRLNVARGDFTGANQRRTTAHRGWGGGLTWREIATFVLDDLHPPRRRRNEIAQLNQHFLTFRPQAEFTDIGINPLNGDLLPLMNSEATAVEVGDMFISKIALCIILYLRLLPADMEHVVYPENFVEHVDWNDFMNEVDNLNETPLQLINRNSRPRNALLVIEFLMQETHEDGVDFFRYRGVNKYENFFLNPEVLINVPGMGIQLQPVLPNKFRPLNLAHRLVNLDIYYAVYRWFQTYQYLGYNVRASFRQIKLTLRQNVVHFDHPIPDNEEMYSLRPFAAMTLLRDTTIRVTLPDNQRVKVFCPQTEDRNCFFVALRDSISRRNLTEFNYEEATEQQKVLRNACSNLENSLSLIRHYCGLGPEEPVNIYTAAAERMCIHFGVAVEIYDCKMTLLREIKWYESPPPVKLMYFSSEECRIYFREAKAYPELAFGHVGIIKDTEQNVFKVCADCRVKYIYTHTCSPERVDSPKRLEHNKAENIRKRFRDAYNKHTTYEKENNVVRSTRPDWKAKFYKKTERQGKDNPHIVYYDFETINAEDNDECTVYAYGAFIGSEYYSNYGELAMSNFIDLLSQSKIHTMQRLCAWNGSRFDAKLIFRFILMDDYWSKYILIDKVLLNGGRLLVLEFKITAPETQNFTYYSLFDPVNFFMCSLKQACSDFKVSEENTKKSFPHKLIHSANDISLLLSLEELNNPQGYYPQDLESKYCLKEPWTSEQVEPFLVRAPAINARDKRVGWKISLRLLSEFYLKADVLGMKEVCSLFFDKIWNSQQYDCWQYITVSQMTYTAWHQTTGKYRKQITIPPSYECYKQIADATYGGRVFVGRKEWISPRLSAAQIHDIVIQVFNQQEFLDERQLDYYGLSSNEKGYFSDPYRIQVEHDLDYHSLESANYLQELDFNSLYPSVMYKYDYPLGLPIYSADMADHQFKFDSTGSLQLGIYTCTYSAPRTLSMACLPQRRKGMLYWDLEEGSQGVFTSIDLENAYLAGYDIKLQDGWLYPEKGKVFQSHVTKAMALKKEGDETSNPALRAYGKLMANSLYGKTLQSLMRDHMCIINTKADAEEFMKNYIWEGATFMGEKVILNGVDPNPEMAKPFQFGAFILSYSRRENWKKFVLIEPSYAQRKSSVFPESEPVPVINEDVMQRAVLNSPVYGDTDSMYVRGNQIDNLDLKDEFLYLKNEDEADYRKKLKKGKPGGVRILWMIAVAVKTYAYVYINSANELRVKIASKGIRPSLLCFRDFIEAAYHYGDATFKGRAVDLGASIRGGVSKHTEGSNFSKIYHVNLIRTFNKTSQSARVTLNDEFQVDDQGVLTVPKGHLFADSFIDQETDDMDDLLAVLNEEEREEQERCVQGVWDEQDANLNDTHEALVSSIPV